MTDISSLNSFFASKFHNALIGLVKPLDQHFELNSFTYSRIVDDGRFTLIGNLADVILNYNANLCFLQCPFFCHPRNFHDRQCFLTAEWPDPSFSESQAVNREKFNLSDFLILSKRVEGDSNAVHLFFFSSNKQGLPLNSIFANNLTAFWKFTDYFFESWKPYFKEMDRFTFELNKEKNSQFYKNPLKMVPDSEKLARYNFLKQIDCFPAFDYYKPLSHREMECSKLLLTGLGNKQIASHLQISERTVEHYIDNIKNKLSCNSKTELQNLIYNFAKHDLLELLTVPSKFSGKLEQ